MKSLALYIDKWYIIGAVSTDGITRLLKLPNKEDRIWLYFYEDTSSDEISYGKGFQPKYRNNENHYYGDVFSQITSSSATYMMFKRPQPMKGIFKSAKIFDDLRKDIGEDGDITTYISFSQDISPAARLLFIKEIEEEHFVVKESIARIGHLALEYTAKKSCFENDGYYIVLNACNENLHYSIYQKAENLFVREAENVLYGMGTDIRSRALIENVVDTINGRENILHTRDEQEAEYLRMTQFVDDWLIRINAAKGSIPVTIPDVTFSRDPYKSYPVSVRKTKIDERTEKIVKDIINVITHFVIDAGVRHEQVQGVLLLGSTFGNRQFCIELCSHYNLPSDKMVSYMDKDLSSLVGFYVFMDCDQFSADKQKIRDNAEAELQRIKIAEEEAERTRRALEESNLKSAEERKKTESERKFKEAMEKGYDAEREHDFDNMEDYFGIALGLCPDDVEAKQKHEEALRKKAEQSVLRDNYKEKIQQAKAASDDADWETAKQKAEEALGFMPDSRDALRIKEESVRHIKSAKALERYLDRADLFIAQKAYGEALQELEKAKLLDINTEEINEREARISKEQGAVAELVSNLTENLNKALKEKRFDDALKSCNELIEVDFANSRKWGVKIADIRQLQEKTNEEERRWASMLNGIEMAHLKEDWEKLVSLCQDALAIQEDSSLRAKLEKAELKISEIHSAKLVDDAIAEIKDLALNSNFKEAKTRLAELRKKVSDSNQMNRIKELSAKIFQKEDEFEDSQRERAKQSTRKISEGSHKSDLDSVNTKKVTRISASEKKAQPFDDGFFSDEEPVRKVQSSKSQPKRETPKPKLNDSFFDD